MQLNAIRYSQMLMNKGQKEAMTNRFFFQSLITTPWFGISAHANH